MRRSLPVLLVAVVAAALPAAAHAVTIQEFPITPGSTPTQVSPYYVKAGPDGHLWVVNRGTDNGIIRVSTAGRQVFLTNCAACHGEDARGNPELGAPNLTDKYWIYGGDLEKIVTSIHGGRQGHMPTWDERLIPASDEVPALLRQITSEARRLIGADPASFRPEPDEPGEFYTKKAYQMQAIGEYHAIARFLSSIASLDRIITPVDLTLTTYANPQGVSELRNPVVADFRIETYVLPEGGAAPPPAQVGG